MSAQARSSFKGSEDILLFNVISLPWRPKFVMKKVLAATILSPFCTLCSVNTKAGLSLRRILGRFRVLPLFQPTANMTKRLRCDTQYVARRGLLDEHNQRLSILYHMAAYLQRLHLSMHPVGNKTVSTRFDFARLA